ncbi:uncharacterized protein LOC143550064 [Bidens hawaiensis]|uniref:uncharacterized protein LOC143550064 n=1 Tax=Bidens hawaiensis TaxID=980011 RepID=UPI00404AD5F8
MENIDKIPDHYVSKHWDTYALPNSVYNIESWIRVDNNDKSRTRIEVLNDVHKCLDRIKDQDERHNVSATKIKELKNNIFEEFPYNPNHRNKKAIIEELLQQSQPEEVCVTAPKGIRNKCSGKRRLIGAREKVVEKANKKKRLYGYCGKYADHDTRNCPKKKKKEAENQNETNDKSSDEEDDSGSE